MFEGAGVTFRVDTSPLAELSAKLRLLGQVIKEEVALDGAAAMAKVMYDEVRLHVSVSGKPHKFYGRDSVRTGVTYTFQPGNLRDAIYRVFSRDQSSDTRKTYQVSWNHRKAPYGFMVEYGTAHAAAQPFMRPSLARIPDAIAAGKARMGVRISAVMGGI
ncbi:HK97-gp10 family putative phage morphogenesis protein [Rugamonas aquatica]|uniref:HK97 gp10 family phage protein n=1 Tax=Rugamonas aquatica TaxID=2743357 RepID=A0A6A7N1X6_9BURK|nr:hypothetical protein [Rugamonas aquatica]MQA39033.1 hypothetical protein [Rugamonas aquatica]